MQPEDIIQAKEWQQLSDADRKAVMSLASTEGEYNVLKKMMLIVQEDADNVPAIDPAIQQQLHTYLAKPPQKNPQILWYAAAASVIVIAFAAFFLLQPKKRDEVATTPTITKPVQQNHIDSQKKDPVLIVPVPIDESNEIAKNPKQKLIKSNPVIRKDSILNLPDVAYVNTSVSDNAPLLVFVTEVY